ncbi:ABC transporter permease [Clostridium aestuarii]|uniref:Transport permease protein n=1 Tax=Clostridium aestuarii TaxID=338193 RepID=A0ABT4CVT9_9CLOT|nr:ABC transporter permease [Clostridium aestuarii]MCY6482922.1 ABC transporter permease [Clostridium aestuarii]
MRAITTIWYREFLNYIRDKARIISSVVMSVTMLFVFTFALGEFDTSMLGIEQIQYLLPGIIATTAFMTSISNALSVVTDKTDGFMKEFLVSPTKRSNIAVGKILGSATTAVIQGTIILAISPFFGMRYTIGMILGIYIAMIAISVTSSSIGLFLASTAKSAIGFQMQVQMLMMPMMFLSGAYVPIELLPNWIRPVVYINPVTYAVSAFRNISINTTNIPNVVLEKMGLVLKIGDFKVTPVVSISIMLIIGLVFLLLAIRAFKRTSITNKVSLKRGMH